MRASRTLMETILSGVTEYSNQPSANRVFFLCGQPMSGKSATAREVARVAGGTYSDFLRDKMSVLRPTVGTYKPKDLQRDVVDWSRTAGGLLVVDEIDPLFDTWNQQQRVDAIRLLSGLTARSACPILLVARLDPRSRDAVRAGKIFMTSPKGG